MSRESYESMAMNARAACHSDDTPVTLTADQKAVALKGISEAIGAAKFVADMVAKDSLTVSVRSNGLGVAFADLERTAAAVGFTADREADHKATQAVLRAANKRIRELEQQLASGVSSEAVAQAVKAGIDSISTAWKTAGFNYAADVRMTARYLEATLHCTADDGRFSFSDSPDSDEKTANERRASLEAAGITFAGDDRHDRSAFDTDANKAAIAQVILGIWPQARITKWESQYRRFGDATGFTIRSANVLIPIDSLRH